MYNFGLDDSRVNIIRVPCVTNKSLSPLGFIVNPYQKPIALNDWFVNHFSKKGDWVADFCYGIGSALVAALLNSRNGCAIDKNTAKIEYVTARVMTLDLEWSLYDEAQVIDEGGEGQEIQPPVAGELGVTGMMAYVIKNEIVEVEEEATKDESPHTPTEADFNDMLLD